ADRIGPDRRRLAAAAGGDGGQSPRGLPAGPPARARRGERECAHRRRCPAPARRADRVRDPDRSRVVVAAAAGGRSAAARRGVADAWDRRSGGSARPDRRRGGSRSASGPRRRAARDRRAPVIERFLRGGAIAIAVLAAIDPSVTVVGTDRPRISIVLEGGPSM